jgi:hypothetical protein
MNIALAVESSDNQYSALEALQIKLISPSPIAAADVHRAVSADLAEGMTLNQTVLLKLFSSTRVNFTLFDYQKLALLIRDSLITLPMSQADLFINYAQCAAVCMKHSLKN